MKITVEEGKCVACGQCVLIAPDVFDQRDEDGIVVVLLMEAPALDLRDTVREALAACPAAAIQLAES